jgi:mRNA interferase MazF
MRENTLQIGDVITAKFPNQNPSGREQEGYRPAIVVGIPSRLGKLLTYREREGAF